MKIVKWVAVGLGWMTSLVFTPPAIAFGLRQMEWIRLQDTVNASFQSSGSSDRVANVPEQVSPIIAIGLPAICLVVFLSLTAYLSVALMRLLRTRRADREGQSLQAA